MLVRKAPELGGYNFEAKRLYRAELYRTFSKTVNPATALLGLMPSWELYARNPCPEIEVAMDAGFKLENMVAIDFNPAIIAKLRAKYPRIGAAIPAHLATACEVLSRNHIKLDILNADLCASASNVSKILAHIANKNCLTKKALVAATALRRDWGSYPKRDVMFGRSLMLTLKTRNPRLNETTCADYTDLDYARFWSMNVALPWFDIIHSGIYKSGGAKQRCRNGVMKDSSTTMMWAIFKGLTTTH